MVSGLNVAMYKIMSSPILKNYDRVKHGTRPKRNNALKNCRLQCVKFKFHVEL